MSLKLNFIKTEIFSNLKCHKNWNFTKTEISPNLKCYQNGDVTKLKTGMTPNLKGQKINSHQKLNDGNFS